MVSIHHAALLRGLNILLQLLLDMLAYQVMLSLTRLPELRMILRTLRQRPSSEEIRHVSFAIEESKSLHSTTVYAIIATISMTLKPQTCVPSSLRSSQETRGMPPQVAFACCLHEPDFSFQRCEKLANVLIESGN